MFWVSDYKETWHKCKNRKSQQRSRRYKEKPNGHFLKIWNTQLKWKTHGWTQQQNGKDRRLSELDDRTIKSPNLSRQKQTGTVKKERKKGKGKEKIKQSKNPVAPGY